MCMHVCVCVRTSLYACVCLYKYIYVCVCVCAEIISVLHTHDGPKIGRSELEISTDS